MIRHAAVAACLAWLSYWFLLLPWRDRVARHGLTPTVTVVDHLGNPVPRCPDCGAHCWHQRNHQTLSEAHANTGGAR